MAANTCPTCDSPLDASGRCWTCEEDAYQARREHGAWRAYVERFKGKMAAIAEAAQQVCDERELELLGADLLEWPGARTAGHLGISEKELKARREAIHEKIRAAIGADRIAEMARRRS